MESQEVILAKLVLGYLKAEKCKTAYKEFLRTSSSLQQLDISHTKFIPTRLFGLTLEDILTEYSDISQIVQGRLEATNYYNEDHPKESLVVQLLYLLNNVPSSRPSTPGFSTPQESRVGDKSPSHINHSDLDATPADALPGNTPCDNLYNSKRKSFNRYGKLAPVTSSPIETQNRSELFDTEVLAENLLENKEFHEKIAQTINKVVERQFDSTIKEVIQETEQDPIFDKLLEEIIGTSNNMLEISKGSESNHTITSTTNISQDNTKENKESQKQEKEKSDNINPNLDLTNKNQQTSANNQISNSDNYILTSQCSVTTNTSISNPIYINTVTGLLLPPLTTVVLNNLDNPQSTLATSSILTEQDIMKMPIIIKDDTNHVKPTKGKKRKVLLKPKMELAPKKELKDYFTNYRPDDSNQSTFSTKPTGLKHVIYPKASRKSPNPVKKPIANSESNIKNSLPIIVNHDEIFEILSSESKNKTPLPTDSVKKATPKSGSHVRNLDFSTPNKVTVQKSDTMNEQKKAVKTLFQQTKMNVWDADLRSTIQSITPKRQAPNKKPKKKLKKTKLNTTEQEGLLLEAAIKTPIKNDNNEEGSTTKKPCEPENIPEKKKSGSNVKIIISPLKLNSSKNNFVDTNNEQNLKKFITPDMVKENVVQPVKSIQNITPMLETPFKYQQLPKTPGVTTPMGFNDDGTPFTKMLDANLNGMDINSIETPSLLNTPGFPPNTPNIDLMTPYNRPTDYSTGSSYYQPSDNEQNKILEAQVREVEKASGTAKEILTVTDHLKIFNKNIIGKKNLSLIKQDLHDSENSNSSCEEENNSIDWCEKESNDTVILKKKTETPRRTYSLRTRSKKIDSPVKKNIRTSRVTKKEIKKPVAKKKIENPSPVENKEHNIQSIISEVIEKSSETSILASGVTASQLSVLKELEKKRLRTIKSFKTTTEPLLQKPKKQVIGKFKIKPIAKVFTTKTGKKAENLKKRKRSKEIEILMNDLITSDDSDVNLALSEDESEEKLNVCKIGKTSSDVEAQNLIEGLKERGIHLMQNKSPKKKNTDETIISSDVQLFSMQRETFDIKNIETEDIIIVYDESKKNVMSPQRTIISSQEEYIGKLYLESIDKEIDVNLKQSEFINLLDIKPNKKESEESKKAALIIDKPKVEETLEIKKIEFSAKENVLNISEKNSFFSCHSGTDKEDEDLMNFAITGNEKPIEKSLSPKSSRKRKLSHDSESEKSHTKMLKGLDVNAFLNKIHHSNIVPEK